MSNTVTHMLSFQEPGNRIPRQKNKGNCRYYVFFWDSFGCMGLSTLGSHNTHKKRK
jgi:hypothetical protein